MEVEFKKKILNFYLKKKKFNDNEKIIKEVKQTGVFKRPEVKIYNNFFFLFFF